MKLTRFKISIRIDNPRRRQGVIETLRSDALCQFSANLDEIDSDGLADCWLSLPEGLTSATVEQVVRERIAVDAGFLVPSGNRG